MKHDKSRPTHGPARGVSYLGSQQAQGNGRQQLQEDGWLLEVHNGPDDEGHRLLYCRRRCSLQPACKEQWEWGHDCTVRQMDVAPCVDGPHVQLDMSLETLSWPDHDVWEPKQAVVRQQ